MSNFRARNDIGLGCDYLTNASPTFNIQPQARVARQGEDVMLAVDVTNACLGHWRFNGNPIGLGCYTRYSLLIASVQPSHAGSYQFIAENYVGSVTSEVAVLTVLSPPQLTAARYVQGAFAFQILEDTAGPVVIETAPDLKSGNNVDARIHQRRSILVHELHRRRSPAFLPHRFQVSEVRRARLTLSAISAKPIPQPSSGLNRSPEAGEPRRAVRQRGVRCRVRHRGNFQNPARQLTSPARERAIFGTATWS